MKKILCFIFTILLWATALGGCAPSPGGGEDIPVEEILQNIRDAYGGDYLPNAAIPDELLEARYELTPDLYEEVLGETPMISAHPDVVLVVKAAAGKGGAVEEALIRVRDRLIEDEMQYPMNVAKTNAAQVVRNGDYVALLLVGAVNDHSGADEAEDARFAQEQVRKGVDAFHASFS